MRVCGPGHAGTAAFLRRRYTRLPGSFECTSMDRLRLTPILLALALCGGAAAQQPAAGPAPAQPANADGQPAMEQLTPEQREALARQDAEMTQAALKVMQLVDANRIGEVWDGASAAMKRLVGREEF